MFVNPGHFCGYFLFAFGFVLNVQAQAPAPLALAAGLFAERNWSACRLECQRQLLESPSFPDALLLKALAEQRMGRDSREALLDLADDPEVPAAAALTARYEWARGMWRAGDWRSAFAGFLQVFEETEITELSVRSGCSLALLLHEHPELDREYPEIKPQVQTQRALYTGDIIDECRMGPQRISGSWRGLPGQWAIAFYRSQIRPALGERCSLVPNCSEYARQAFQKHGVLGLAITADRFFREPSVVAAAEHPVNLNGKCCYADPLSEHDWWLGDGGRTTDDGLPTVAPGAKAGRQRTEDGGQGEAAVRQAPPERFAQARENGERMEDPLLWRVVTKGLERN